MRREIPNEADWGNWRQDVDQKFAHDLYFGRSNEEMQERYIDAPIEAASELQFMPTIPFQYYVLGFRDSLLSGRHREFNAANAASCFLRLMEARLKASPRSVLDIRKELQDTLEHLAINQDNFGTDRETFGDFAQLVQEIQAAMAALSH